MAERETDERNERNRIQDVEDDAEFPILDFMKKPKIMKKPKMGEPDGVT